MLNSELVRKAHKMAKEIKREYPEVNYRFQYGLCLSYLLKGEVEMVELKGSEKQVKWAEDIRSKAITALKNVLSTVKENKAIMPIAWKGDKVVETEEYQIYPREEGFPIAIQCVNDLINVIENIETSSKFYIENQNNLYTALATKHNIRRHFNRLLSAYTDIKACEK